MEDLKKLADLLIKSKTTQKEKISISIDPEKAMKRFLSVANKIIPGYVIDNENQEVITKLIKYFNNEETDLDPSKSITLCGNVGSGKTKILEIFSKCQFPNKEFGIKECRDMSELFINENYKGIRPYAKGSLRPGNKLMHMLFDDLGAENEINYYGNKVNVMENIILDRYKHYENHRLITHFTTNLDKEQIESKYGTRILSRMSKMTNFVGLGGSSNSKDRRL